MSEAEATRPPWRAFVGLGASLDDQRLHLEAALAALADTPGVELRAHSRLYRTRPVGAAQNLFSNAAAELRCTLAPLALMQRLLEIEAERGRVRDGTRGDRSLDLDLLAGLSEDGPLQVETPALTLPHPRAHDRDFALAPLCELAPSLELAGSTVCEQLRALPAAARTVLAITDWLVPTAAQS